MVNYSDENELFDGAESYELPKPKDVVFDKSTGKIIDQSKPIYMLLAAAQEAKIRIKTPSFKDDGSYDTGCRRKDCMGRGYTSIKEGMPVPCSCLFYHEDLKNPERNRVKLNRKGARKYVSVQESSAKSQKRELAISMGYRQVDKDIWINKKNERFLSRWNEGKNTWIFEKIK